MTQRLVLPVLLSLLCFSSAIAQKKTHIEELRMLGPVRTLTEETEWSGKPRVKTLMISFNRTGNKTEEIKYSSEGAVQSRTAYSYDSKDNLIGEAHYDREGKAYLKESHSYDANSRRTESLHFNGEGKATGKTSYTYDAAGRLKEESYEGVRALGSWSSNKKITYSYDDNGLLLSNRSDATEGARTTYKYDHGGRLVRQTDHLLHGAVEYSFGNRGNLTKKISGRGALPNPGPFDSEELYSYEYGSQENWVKQTTTAVTGKNKPDGYSFGTEEKLISTKYRTITYY